MVTLSLQRRGKDYDNLIAKKLHRETDWYVQVSSTRGSGNTATPQPDVLVRTSVDDHGIELKKTSVDTNETAYVLDEDDAQQLYECYNPYTRVWLGVKFSRRELLLVEGDTSDRYENDDATYRFIEDIPECFDPHITDSGTLRLTKPSTDSWPSSTAGRDDVQVICDELEVQRIDE